MMRSCRKDIGFVVTLVAGLSLVADASGAASFQGLGDLPGGDIYSSARKLSADGSVVLGNSLDASGYRGYRWTSADGMTTFDIPSGGVFSQLYFPEGLSADGSVFVGGGITALGTEAYRWSQSDGLVGLGDLPGGEYFSSARAVSADGSVIVGIGGIEPEHEFVFGPDAIPYEPFIWTAGSGMVGLGGFAGEPVGGEATDVSADGSVVVGQSTIVTSPGEPWESFRISAFRWTQATGMTDLGFEEVAAISSDGSTVVGYSQSDFGEYDAFLWTESTGRVHLGEPLNDRSLSQAWDVSGDGSTIVGVSWETGPPITVIWDAVHGSRDLKEVLENQYGLDLTGWSLEGRAAISDDGLTIVGTGTNPNGDVEAFIAVLPEPGTMVLMALGMSALFRRR